MLNAWPLDEGYIEATIDSNAPGIENSEAYPEINAGLLRDLNERDGDANISTGYHAIEFLLWGQDTSATGPGNRSINDFTDDAVAARRLAYLSTVTDVLIEDLTSVANEWRPDGAYRAGFLSDPEAAVGKIIIGMGSLCGGELAGERMAVALENKDQEDEHSCFSDNTHRDIATNLQGIVNVWTGTYVRPGAAAISGPVLQISLLLPMVNLLRPSLLALQLPSTQSMLCRYHSTKLSSKRLVASRSKRQSKHCGQSPASCLLLHRQLASMPRLKDSKSQTTMARPLPVLGRVCRYAGDISDVLLFTLNEVARTTPCSLLFI